MKYRPEIDGLRALAVMPVILFHAGFALFGGGFVGVDVFFVISGYLITGIIISELRAGSFSIMKFYERRARRILPALFLVLLVSLPFAIFWLLPDEMKKFSKSLISVMAFLSNIIFWLETGYFDTANELKPLLHTWSLAVEEQYYVFFPILLMLFWRSKRKWILPILALLFLISFAAAQWGSLNKPDFAFYLLPSRIWELLVGAFIAFYFSSKIASQELPEILKQSLSLGGLGLLLYANIYFDKETPFPGWHALVPTLGAGLIIFAADQTTWVGRLLSNKILVGVGLISYSAYLWHQPIFAFTRQITFGEPSEFIFLLLMLLTLTLAFLSWKYVEAPFREKNKISREQVFKFAVFGTLFFTVVGMAGYASQGFAEFADSTTKHLMQAAAENKRNWDCWAKIERAGQLKDACSIGKPSAPKTFAVYGDSHASALLETLGRLAENNNMSGHDYTLNGCAPLKSSVLNALGDMHHKRSCQNIKREFFEGLSTGAIPPVIVISARWSLIIEKDRFDNGEGGVEPGIRYSYDNPEIKELGYVKAIQNDYIDTVNSILRSGRKVVLIYPFPEQGWNTPAYLMRINRNNGHLGPSDGSSDHEVFKKRNANAIAALDAIGENENLVRIFPDKVLCDSVVKGRCISHIKASSLYSDNNHLSNAGAAQFAESILLAIKHLSKSGAL